MGKLIDYYKKRYIKTMSMYMRQSKKKSTNQFNKYMLLMGNDLPCFTGYILLEIESAREDYYWRKHHVMKGEV